MIHDLAVLTGAFRSVLVPGSATYCSAPITSGRRYLDWLTEARLNLHSPDDLSEQQRNSHANSVIAENTKAARCVVQSLRSLGKTVIDPTEFPNIREWSQGQWREFWARVIREYALEVVFVDGWEYSSGCTFEFLVATDIGLPKYDERLTPITTSKGVGLIKTAVNHFTDRGIDAAFLRETMVQLQSMPSARIA